jgi:acetyl esterase/lipase
MHWLTFARGDKHGPPLLRKLSARLSKRFTLWQSVVLTLLWLYVGRNFSKIAGLESPEPLENLYSRSFFRATWILTALDAGFWTAMKIRNRRLRDLASFVFTIYYLFVAEQADEKVRKIRAVLTVDHMRIAWNKPTTPYLSFFTRMLRPRFTKYGPRRIRIPRPKKSTYKEPINAWMYFDGPLSELKRQTNVVLDIPGGGFVAMNPRTSDDKLLAWAGRTNLPILSLDYRKAPEFPYPYALNECFDVYTMIITTKGRCIGMEPATCPRIVLTGDSAGGNLATSTTLMIIQSNGSGGTRGLSLPSPAGLVLMYPALDMNLGSWMTDDQMALIRNPRTVKKHENFIRRKSEDIDNKYTPATPRPSEDNETNPFEEFMTAPPKEDETGSAKGTGTGVDVEAQKKAIATSKPQPLKTRLAVSSVISYFNDRILTPEMMRAMVILYVGPYSRPDFTTDHLLCPAVAPEPLLARFPKTYFLTGERDPLVDDTVLFAGRLRQAKLHLFQERKEIGLEKSNAEFAEKDHVEVALIPGISHGFVQFVSIYPDGWKHIYRCGKWIQDIFAAPPGSFEGPSIEFRARNPSLTGGEVTTSSLEMNGVRHHQRALTGESTSGDEEAPLHMTTIRSATPPITAKDNIAVRGGRGRGQGSASDKRHTASFDKTKSSTSLASEEDLLGRRMDGLTAGLIGSELGESDAQSYYE